MVLHWDGKIIKLLSGQKEDRRLAIAISAPNKIPGQLLASPIIPRWSGKEMAKVVIEIGNT